MIAGLIFHTIAGSILSFFLHLIFHEIGHLLGGLLTGWSFLYLQLFNLALVKENKTISFRIVSSCNFQCIMSPASLYSNPYVYIFGGCLINLLLTIVGLKVVLAGGRNIVAFIYGWSLFVMGAGFLVMNGVPRVRRICNDMACYRMLVNDKLTRLCHNLQLIAARLLFKGASYRQLGEGLLALPSDYAYNDILAYQALLEYYFYLDMNDYESMKRALGKIKDERNLSHLIKSYYKIELIYISLIDKIKSPQLWGLSKSYYQSLLKKALAYDGQVKTDLSENYLLKHSIKGDLHFERVKAAFDAYHDLLSGSREKARERLIMATHRIRNMGCLYQGEKEFCIRQLNLLIKHMDEMLDEKTG